MCGKLIAINPIVAPTKTQTKKHWGHSMKEGIKYPTIVDIIIDIQKFIVLNIITPSL